jgi:hypothetical protein
MLSKIFKNDECKVSIMQFLHGERGVFAIVLSSKNIENSYTRQI